MFGQSGVVQGPSSAQRHIELKGEEGRGSGRKEREKKGETSVGTFLSN